MLEAITVKKGASAAATPMHYILLLQYFIIIQIHITQLRLTVKSYIV